MKKRKRYPELNALKGRIREQHTSYRKVAISIGMAVNTLSDKINGFYALGIPEAQAIAEFLDIDPREMDKYFFPTMLSFSTKYTIEPQKETPTLA